MTRERLRILFVVHGFPPEFVGGTEIYTLRSAQALTALGHEVEIVTGSAESRPIPEVVRTTYEGLTVHRIHRHGLFLDNWEKSYAPEVESLLHRIISDVRPDLVHVHHWIRLTRNLVETCHAAGVPAVVTLHDLLTDCARCFRVRDESFCRRPLSAESCIECVPKEEWHSRRDVGEEIELYREDFRQELRLARRVMVPSHGHRMLLAQSTGMDPALFHVQPHGQIANIGRQSFVPSIDGRIRLAHWGHFYPMKGVHLLLEALRLLPDRARERFQIDLFGRSFDADYDARLKELARGLQVSWRGPYQPADLTGFVFDWSVLPSVASESHSFVLDESFELGVPALVSDRGALSERLHGAGLAFRAEDPGALAGVLLRILENQDLNLECREKIPELYPMPRHAASLCGVYQEVLAYNAPLPQGSFRLRDRHRVHEAMRVEDRGQRIVRVLDETRAEKSRADDLEQQLRLAEKSVAGHEALIADLQTSIAQYVSERDRLTAEYQALSTDRDRWQNEYRELEKAHVSLGQRHLADNQTYQTTVGDLERERARLHTELTERRSEGVRLSAEVAGLISERALLEGKIHDQLRAIADYRTVVSALEQRIAEARAETLKERDRQGVLATELKKRDLEIDRLQKGTAELKSHNSGIESRLSASESEIQSLKQQQRELQGALQRERQEVSRLLDEQAAELGRSAALEAELSRNRSVAEDVARKVQALTSELGLASSAEVPALYALPESLDSVTAATHRTKNLMGEMQKAIDRLAAESQLIEEERQSLESALRSHEDALLERRRKALFRMAERVTKGPRLDVRSPARSASLTGGTRGLRILMVIHDFLPRHAAGSEIYTYQLAKALSSNNDVHLLFTEAHPGVHSYRVREDHYDGIPFIEISHQHTTEYFERTYRDPNVNGIFRDVLQRLKPDVIHVQHLYHLSIDLVSIAKERGIPVVYTLHEYALLCPRGGQMLRADLERCTKPVPEKCADCISHYRLDTPPEDEGRAHLASRIGRHMPMGVKAALKSLLSNGSGPKPVPPAKEGLEAHAVAIQRRLSHIKEALRDVDLFISPSEFLRKTFVESGLIPPAKVIVSDNGQNAAPFAGVTHVASSTLRIGYIGTISDYKGLHVLVEAMNRLAYAKDLECHVHGSLSSFPGYAADLQALSKNPRTLFHGRYEHARIGDVLSNLDILVVPSLWWENSPLTIHEAFMANVPVIASDIGGMAEFVKDGENGLLFKVGDPDALADRVREVLADRGLLERLRNRRLRIKSIAEDSRDMEERYKRLISANTGKASSKSMSTGG